MIIGKQIKKFESCCARCENLKAQITLKGFKPHCDIEKKKFKERRILDYRNDKDINNFVCEKFSEQQIDINSLRKYNGEK